MRFFFNISKNEMRLQDNHHEKKKFWWFWMKSQDELFYEYYRLGFFKIAIDHIIWLHYFFHTL